MGYIYVKNKKGTGDKTPPAGYTSWLDFWEKKKGKKASICEAWSCSNSAILGGHVIKSGEGGKEYILPLCSSHNNKSESDAFQAWEADLVSIT